MTEAILKIKVDSSEAEKGKRSLDDLAKSGAAAEGSSKKLTDQTERMSTAAKTAYAAFTALAGSLAVRQVIQYADEWQNAENRLRLVTNTSSELAQVQQILLRTANETRSGFANTAELFTVLTRSTTALGLSQQEIIDLTRTINQTFAVAGASAQSMDGAIRQLSQGLASGALRGDEFNTVAENAPGILDAVAASLRMGRGELREFAATGGITAEILVKAIQGYADVVERDFAKAQRTFGQSMTQARNNALEFVGSSNLVKASTQALGDALVTASENLENIATAATVVAGVMVARMIPGLASTAAATAAASIESVRYQAALAAMSGTSLTAATATGTLRTALALVGGPTGALIIAAGSLVYFVSKMESANESTERLLNSLEELNREELGRGIEAQRAYNQGLETRIERLSQQNMSVAANRERMAELRAELEKGQVALQKLELGMKGIDDREFGEMLDEYFPPLQQFTQATEAATAATIAHQNAIGNFVRQLDAAAAASYSTEAAYLALMESQGAMIESSDEVTTRTTRLTEAQKNANLTNQDAQDSIDEIVEGLGRQSAASEALTQVTNLMRDDISSAFADMMMNGGNAFDNIAKSFERMVYKMVADWAASGIMNLIGQIAGISGLGGTSALGSILGGLGAKAAGAAAGTAATAAAGTAAAGTAAAGGAAAGGGIISGITGAVSSAGSAISGAVAAVPGWGWALAGGAALAALADKSTPSSNAGFLLKDVPGASADRKFQVEPFESGFQPVGFARRESQAEAAAVIDVFRKYDAAMTEMAEAAGIAVNMDWTKLGGIGSSETGQGNGVFVGIAAEDGRVKSQSLDEQLNEYVTAWINGLGSQINPGAKSAILAEPTADDKLRRAAELVAQIDGSLASGIDYVPFDGYRAELHKGERVQTAAEARAQDAGWGIMARELSAMRSMMTETALSTRRTADLLLRVTRDGESLVTVAA